MLKRVWLANCQPSSCSLCWQAYIRICQLQSSAVCCNCCCVASSSSLVAAAFCRLCAFLLRVRTLTVGLTDGPVCNMTVHLQAA
jgi:hypothetical protein